MTELIENTKSRLGNELRLRNIVGKTENKRSRSSYQWDANWGCLVLRESELTTLQDQRGINHRRTIKPRGVFGPADPTHFSQILEYQSELPGETTFLPARYLPQWIQMATGRFNMYCSQKLTNTLWFYFGYK